MNEDKCSLRSSFILYPSSFQKLRAAARDHRADDWLLLCARYCVEDRIDVQPHEATVAINDRLTREAHVVVDKGRDAVLRRPPLERLLVLRLEFFDGHFLSAAA